MTEVKCEVCADWKESTGLSGKELAEWRKWANRNLTTHVHDAHEMTRTEYDAAIVVGEKVENDRREE